MWEGLSTIASLMGCLIISSNYRSFRKMEEKKFFGACFGLFVVFIICGEHIIHPMFITIVNILLILQDNKKYVHVKSLGISFSYLALMHLGIIECPKYAIEVHMIITLRLVGLCFELNTSYLIRNRGILNVESQFLLNENVMDSLKDVEEIQSDPELIEIFTYIYNYIGILKGPYYNWKTFKNYFELPLGNYRLVNAKITRKIDNIPVTFVMYVWLNIFYPLNVCYYEISPFDFSTFWCCYNIPRLVIVYLHYYMIISICEAICIEAGLGIYPASCDAEPGFGPTKQFELIQQLKKSKLMLLTEKYNYNTVKIFGEHLVFTNYKMRKSLKQIDMTTQYWFWANIYRRLPYNDKFLKSSITLCMWGIWSGVNVSNLILVSTILLYMYVEDIYDDILTNSSQRPNSYKNAIQIGTCLALKTMCFIYVTPLFYNLEAKDIINFYNSTKWSFHGLLVLLLICGHAVRCKQTFASNNSTAVVESKRSTVES